MGRPMIEVKWSPKGFINEDITKESAYTTQGGEDIRGSEKGEDVKE